MKKKEKTLISDQLDAHVDKLKKAYVHKNKEPRFIPSNLGTPCLRKLHYIYTKVDQDYDVDVNVKKAGVMGSLLHDEISGYLRDLGLLIDYHEPNGDLRLDFDGNPDFEFPVKAPDLKLKGKIDAVMPLKDGLWLGEFKSVTDYAYKELIKAKRMGVLEPKRDHLAQGLMYLYIFAQGLVNGDYAHIEALKDYKKVEGVLFFYINKNNFEFLEIPIKRNDQLFINIVNKLKTVEQYHEKGVLPPKTKDMCSWCNWRKKCEGNVLK